MINCFKNRIKNKALIRNQAYINGAWVTGEKTIPVTNPSTADVLGEIPNLTKDDAETAIRGAEAALTEWAAKLASERGTLLARWAQLMRDNKQDLAAIMTLEQGKPLQESLGEIDYATSFLQWYAEEGQRAYGRTMPTHVPHSKIIISKHPIGVTAAITPWNFPSAMITRKAGAALAAGCPMVVRPDSQTPYSALALAVLAEQAGVPKGVFSVITGDAPAIGQAFCEDTAVKKISFTGSTNVGRILLSQSADTVKKLTLELGGHAPFIAFDDCDLPLAIKGAIGAKFATTGQDCLAVNRLFVHEKIYDDFAAQFTKATKALKTGDGFDNVDLGPLMNEAAIKKCEEHIEDALQKGAKLLAGGKRDSKDTLFFQPTVLGDVTPEMQIYQEETFGPVTPLIKFSDENNVIAEANNSQYGLAAYIYSTNINRCHRVSDGLNYGMVGVNTPKFTGAPVPFGGMNQSGLGREGGLEGLDEYMETKYICLGNLNT